MARKPVADIEIDGQPYVLAKPPFGIRLGFYAKEPGSPGQLRTIEIESFHLGPGEFLARTPGRYFSSKNVEPGVPGQLNRVGQYTLPTPPVVGRWGRFETDSATPSFYPAALLLLTTADGTPNDVIVAVTPKDFVPFNAGADTAYLSGWSSSLNSSNTGSVAKHKGQVFVPQEGDAAHATPRQAVSPMGVYDPKTGVMTNWTDAANLASRVLSSRGKFWWVQNKGLGGIPEIRAHPTPARPPPTDIAGPFQLSPGPYCTGLMRFGYWVRAAMADGNLHGIDEEGIVAPLLPEIMASPGTTSGSHMVAFLGKVAVSVPGRIFAIDLASLEVTDISPPTLHGETPWSPGRTAAALWSDGVDLWAAAHSTLDPNNAELWRLSVQPDGAPAWHRIATYATSGTTIPQALLLWDGGSAGRFAYILCQQAATVNAALVKVRVPWPGNQPPITSGYEAVNSHLRTPYYRAGANTTAKFLQVRGFVRAVPVPALGVDYSVDLGSFTSLGTYAAAAGPFTLPFLPSSGFGRTVAFDIKADVAQLALPLFLDYLEIPGVSDELTIDIRATDTAINNRGGVFRKSALKTVAELRALRAFAPAVHTLTFLNSVDAAGKPASWDVVVVDVSVEPMKAEWAQADEARVSLLVKRVV